MDKYSVISEYNGERSILFSSNRKREVESSLSRMFRIYKKQGECPYYKNMGCVVIPRYGGDIFYYIVRN